MKRAFTLMEMLVVLAILALLASIAFRFGDRFGEGQRAAQCQAQLRAIYQALKMYKLDEGGVPPFDPLLAQDSDPTKDLNQGLWVLYNLGYIKSRRTFKCPDNEVSVRDFESEPDEERRVLLYWREMNGYQRYDEEAGQWPYQPDLGITDPSNPNYYRQLQPTSEIPRRWWPRDDTVVTWCRFHRGLYRKGNVDQDVVLFWDGRVCFVPSPANHFVSPTEGGG